MPTQTPCPCDTQTNTHTSHSPLNCTLGLVLQTDLWSSNSLEGKSFLQYGQDTATETHNREFLSPHFLLSCYLSHVDKSCTDSLQISPRWSTPRQKIMTFSFVKF